MVTWQSSCLGALAAADAASAEGLAQIQPGQEPGWTLHLVSWRIYTLTLMGRWREVAPLGLRARQLWEEIGRETAGYAVRGFIAAAHVARSRGESALAESLAEVVESIAREFEGQQDVPGGVRWRWLPLLRLDRAGLESVTAAWAGHAFGPDSLERQLSAMSDRRWTVPASTTAPLLDRVTAHGLRPLEIQVRRAAALREGDGVELERTAAIAAECDAGSPLARLRYELARWRSDKAGMDAAIEALEAIGDRWQIALYRG